MLSITETNWHSKEHSIYAGDKLILMCAISKLTEEERQSIIELAKAAPDMLRALTAIKILADKNELKEDYSVQAILKLSEDTLKKVSIKTVITV